MERTLLEGAGRRSMQTETITTDAGADAHAPRFLRRPFHLKGTAAHAAAALEVPHTTWVRQMGSMCSGSPNLCSLLPGTMRGSCVDACIP